VWPASGRKAGQTSGGLCHQPKAFDWRAHSAGPHALKRLDVDRFNAACALLNQIIEIG